MTKLSVIKLSTSVTLACAMVVAFQNCSVAKFERTKKSLSQVGTGTPDTSVDSSGARIATTNPQSVTSCSFDGQEVPNGQSVTAYLASTVNSNQQCQSETRVCDSGNLSGSFNFASCTPGQKQACLFNGQTIADGQNISAYQSSSVASGQSCVSEARTCSDGTLSGSYGFASCNVAQPASCLFNGQTIAHGQSVSSYQSSSVAYGQSCVSEARTCSNGILSGSYSYANCNIGKAASCIFNGQTIANGQSVVAHQSSSVAYGQSCVTEARVCSDGTLSGSYSFANCNADQPASCLFDGQTVANGQSVSGFQASSVAYGQSCVSEVRACLNGTLSGSYNFASCNVGQAASCLFNGQTVANGEVVVGYQTSSVAYGQSCVPEGRVCANGTLSGSYSFASCNVGQAASCIFNGQTIASGQSVNAYQTSSVSYGQSCISQTRTCTNGALSGSYNFANCTQGQPTGCLFNGQTIAHGQSVNGFQASSVPYGQSCNSQTRVCSNGALSGSYSFASCNVAQPASCLFNGQTIVNGQSVLAYQSGSVPYGQYCNSYVQARTCTNGVLSGSYTYASCTVQSGASCNFNGQTVPSGQSVNAYQINSVAYGQSCSPYAQTRTCVNGSLSGSYSYASCSVAPGVRCNFNGQMIPDGQYITAYQVNSVVAGQSCSSYSQTRYCSNGTLTGTYGYASCSVQSNASCTLDGQTIPNGQTVIAYRDHTPREGKTCQDDAEYRTCNNGTLSGDDSRDALYCSNSPFVNFVAGDKATCEASVVNYYGDLRQACTIGGGCGNCGVPGPGCNSANPSLYGACVMN